MGRWQKRWVVVIAVIALLYNVLALAVAIYGQHIATRPPYFDPQKSYAEIFGVTNEELARWFNSERFSRLPKERVRLQSAGAETINVLLVHAPGSAARGTVLLWGYPYSVMPIGDVFLDRGFNVLVFSMPMSKIRFDYDEHYVLNTVVTFAREKDPHGLIGVYMMSAGAAMAVQHAAMNTGEGAAAFYVIDCAFSDLEDLFAYHFQRQVGFRRPPLVKTYTTAVNYLRDGYFLGDVSPRRSIVNVRTPMLFIHGRADTQIPLWMTEELYKAKPGAKLLLTHDGGHGLIDARGGGAIVQNREAFERKVDELLALAATKGETG